jgi:hypothetical protein
MFDSKLSVRHVIRGLVFLVLVMAAGTAWFVFMEDHSFLDGLYMTVITISTVGFREVVALDGSGRLFTVFPKKSKSIAVIRVGPVKGVAVVQDISVKPARVVMVVDR